MSKHKKLYVETELGQLEVADVTVDCGDWEVPAWNDAKTKHVPEQKPVLALIDRHFPVIARKRKGEWEKLWDAKKVGGVTHWVPLPPKPKD